MNNHCVPDDNEEEDYPTPIPSSTPKKHSVQNDEIMELLWQNGQVVLQSQNQRQLRKPSLAREVENCQNNLMFMQEDEMTSWLHYTIDEDPPSDHLDFCADMLYAPPPNHRGAREIRPVAAPLPPIPRARMIQNFAHFVKHGNGRAETASLRQPASLKAAASVGESTVVDSCETPAAAAVSRSSAEHRETDQWNASVAGKEASSAGGGETATPTATFEMTVTSSPGGSSGSAKPVQREPVVDRKRKGREAEDSEFQSEDVDFDSPEAKKQVHGSTSTKRSRAAEVHNLSERRRRERINEKMKALQELIPRCNKTDKASMLDEAIEYLKLLQLQVQMMSMGCGVLPMMLPGMPMQQCMPPMGMGMGMEMGMNRPVMPFPNMLAKSALPAATAPTHHLGPRFPMPPPFHVPHVNGPDPSKMQAENQLDNGTPDADNQSHIPNFTDPYQQYLGPRQMHLHLMQAMNQPNATKPSISKGQENPEKHHPEQS